MKKTILTIGLAALALAGVNAQILYSGGTYSENFNGLISSGNVTSVFSATSGTQAGIPSLSGWSGAKIGGTGTSATNFVANDGSSNAGGLYSYGSTSDSDRALGSLASGTNIMAFGAEFLNNGSTTYTQFTITFDAEFWRSSTSAVNTLSFFYGFSSTAGLTSSNYLSSTLMTALTSLDVVGPAPVTTNGALDGNAAGNRTAGITATISSVSWAPGESLFIAWRDANDPGNDAGLAVDNFSFSAIPEPTTWALLAGSLTVLTVFRRRRNS